METVKEIAHFFRNLEAASQVVYERVEKKQMDPQLSVKVKAVIDSCQDVVSYINARIDPHG